MEKETSEKMKKSIISVLSAVVGAAVGAGVVGKNKSDEIEKIRSMSDKHLALYLMMNQWVKVKQEGKNLASYLEKNEFKKIAIYGMSYVGETLISELKNTGVEVGYGIDRNADSIYADIDVVSVDSALEQVDAIIVTAITYFDEIEEMLSARVSCPIISLEDILYEI